MGIDLQSVATRTNLGTSPLGVETWSMNSYIGRNQVMAWLSPCSGL